MVWRSFAALPVELQLHVLTFVEPVARYHATLTCARLREYSDGDVAFYRRLHQLLGEREMRRQRRVTLEITGEARAHRWEFESTQRICIRGADSGPGWAVVSVIGGQVTKLNTPSLRAVIQEVARLLPGLRAVGKPLHIIRNAWRHWSSHVFRAPDMALEGQCWLAPSCPAHGPDERAAARLRLILQHLGVHDSVRLLFRSRRGRTIIDRPDTHDIAWHPPAFIVSHAREAWEQSSQCTLCDQPECVLGHLRSHRIATIELERNLGDDKQHFIYPDFDFVAPAWMRPLSTGESVRGSCAACV